jgi:tRNA (adenine57-N1/adenine58-N1)-methyltransferase
MTRTISENDSVALIDEKGNKFVIVIEKNIQKIKGLGVYDPGELLGKKYYEDITIGNRRFSVVEPSISDKIEAMERKAQIIMPKDGMFILYYCNIKSGDKVIEAGIGSGALSILLANFIRPKGKIISYDKRDDHIKVAKKNLIRSGLSEFVEIKKGDVTEEITENDADSVIFDIPNPEDAIRNGCSALKLGGYLAVYTPTINQFERAVREMENYGFGEIKTLETIQREMIVGKRGVRPSFNTLGHTGYITFARRLI